MFSFADIEFNERQEKLVVLMLFLGKLIVLGLILRLIIQYGPDTLMIQEFYAIMIGIILTLVFELEIEGINIIIGDSIYAIVQDCLGWKSMYLLTSLYVATPNKYSENFKLLLSGLVILQLSNIVRVVSTVVLTEMGVISFEVIHSFLWQWGLSFIVFGLWYYWYIKILGE